MCLFFHESKFICNNLKLGKCFWIILRVLWQILLLKCCVCKFVMACLDMLFLYLPLQILLSTVFPEKQSIWFVLLVGGLRIISPHPRHSEQVKLHCFRPAVQFPWEICWRTYSIVQARCLQSLFLAFAMFFKSLLMIGCIHSIEVG